MYTRRCSVRKSCFPFRAFHPLSLSNSISVQQCLLFSAFEAFVTSAFFAPTFLLPSFFLHCVFNDPCSDTPAHSYWFFCSGVFLRWRRLACGSGFPRRSGQVLVLVARQSVLCVYSVAFRWEEDWFRFSTYGCDTIMLKKKTSCYSFNFRAKWNQWIGRGHFGDTFKTHVHFQIIRTSKENKGSSQIKVSRSSQGE